MSAGTCRICGCTDDRACEGGCSWANEGHTICSTCQDASLLAMSLRALFRQLDALAPERSQAIQEQAQVLAVREMAKAIEQVGYERCRADLNAALERFNEDDSLGMGDLLESVVEPFIREVV